MKKKLLLLAVMAALLVCALAVTASAAVTGSASNEFGTVTTYDSIAEKDKLKDTTSRVVLKNADETYSTYPAYYVLANNVSTSFDFAALNALTGESYSKTSVARIELPDAITSIGGSMFASDKELVEISLPSKLTTVNGSAFNDCTNLQYIDGNDGLLIFPEGFKTISANNAFYNCDKIKYVEFPSTFTYLGQAAFHDCDGLLLVSFDKINEAIANGTRTARVDFNNCGSFKYCDNLVALALPELTTIAINRLATGCTNLTAVYLPDSIKEIGTNGGSQGAFDDCGKMYFVQDSFTVSQCIVNGDVDLTKLILPEKPSVYYMPTSLERFIGHVESHASSKGGTIFKNCTSLNETIVFGESFTFFNSYNCMSGVGTKDAPKNIVFLANMTSAITTQNTSYINFYFANPADKSPEDIGIVRYLQKNNTTGSYWYFCNGGARYDYAIDKNSMSDDMAVNLATILATKDEVNFVHIAEKQGQSEATCTLPAGLHTYCFCGMVKSSEIAEGSVALGHDASVENGAVDLGIVYGDYFAKGAHGYVCARCGEEYAEDTAELFVWQGYSARTFGEGYAVTQSYVVNKVAITDFQKYNDVEFGVFATVNAGGEVITPVLGGEGVYSAALWDVKMNDYLEIIVNNIPNNTENVENGLEEVNNKDKNIVFCLYVAMGDSVSFLDSGKTSQSLAGISYQEILNVTEN